MKIKSLTLTQDWFAIGTHNAFDNSVDKIFTTKRNAFDGTKPGDRMQTLVSKESLWCNGIEYYKEREMEETKLSYQNSVTTQGWKYAIFYSM